MGPRELKQALTFGELNLMIEINFSYKDLKLCFMLRYFMMV
jgi:hypothetical protein